MTALVPIVRPTNWTIATCMTAHDVDALAFAVATTVVFQALVHILTNRWNANTQNHNPNALYKTRYVPGLSM